MLDGMMMDAILAPLWRIRLFFIWLAIFLFCLFSIESVNPGINGVIFSLIFSLVPIPILKYLRRKDEADARQMELNQQYYAREEYMKYMKGEKAKYDDNGQCPNCSMILAENTTICPNCGLNVGDYT